MLMRLTVDLGPALAVYNAVVIQVCLVCWLIIVVVIVIERVSAACAIGAGAWSRLCCWCCCCAQPQSQSQPGSCAATRAVIVAGIGGIIVMVQRIIK